MIEADTVSLWDCFYRHFQNSKTLSQSHENETVVVQNAGASLLLDTGKSFAFDLFKSCGLLGGDIIKLNHILWKLEERCLPQVAVMFETFKQSVEVTGISQDDVQPTGTRGSESAEDAPDTEQSQITDSKIDVSGLECTFKKVYNSSNNSSKSAVSEIFSPVLEQNEKSGKLDRTRSSKTGESLAKPVENVLTSVRRSGRSVKITPRFQDVRKLILKTIKPEPSTEVGEEEKVIKPQPRHGSEPETEVKKVECDAKRFQGGEALSKQHQQLKEHGERLEKSPRLCPMCDTPLESGQALQDHMLTHIPSAKAYSCDLCQEAFSTLGLARVHSLSHLGLAVSNHMCILCGKTFRSERLVDVHIRRTHAKNCADRIFQCPQCPKRFRDKEQLDYHSVRHSDVKPYSCNVCGKTFLREKGLINHKRMHEGGGFMCDVCGKSFINQRVLEDHSTIHTGEKPHTCDVCGKSFRLYANLRYHKQVHNPTKSIQCLLCPKTFRDSRSYSRHMMMHTGEKPWRCQICGKGFVQEITLKKHMNLHNGENRHQCKVCLRSFVDKWGLIKHSTIHTGERPYQCSICKRSFRIKKGLEDHFKLHDPSLQLKCPLCPKTFVEKRHLDHHLRMHRGEKAYVCEICGDRFVNSMSLKVHHRRHTGEKPYKCSYCPKTFNQHGTHAAHERFHRGERPFACDFCEAAFITRSQLNIHRRKHLNIRPYKCTQCDYAATTASLLKVHSLKHSSEKPFRCSLCPAAFKRQNHLDVHTRKHQAREEVIAGDESRSIIHITGAEAATQQTDTIAPGTVTVVEVFQCSFCEATFPTQAGLEKHMKRHEIIVVTAAANQDGIFEIPAIEGAHGASSEVAYDIVLL